MMIAAHIPSDIKYLLFSEAMKLVTNLNWLLLVDIDRKNLLRVEQYRDILTDFLGIYIPLGKLAQ